MRRRFIFAVNFAAVITSAAWLVTSETSPLQESFAGNVIQWLLTPLLIVPYLVIIILGVQGLEEFVAVSLVFLQALLVGLVLYSVFQHFFPKRDAGRATTAGFDDD
jgi:hypothetical protein